MDGWVQKEETARTLTLKSGIGKELRKDEPPLPLCSLDTADDDGMALGWNTRTITKLCLLPSSERVACMGLKTSKHPSMHGYINTYEGIAYKSHPWLEL
jgi:hypothetical protein